MEMAKRAEALEMLKSNMQIRDVVIRTGVSDGTVMHIKAAMDVENKEKLKKLMQPGL